MRLDRGPVRGAQDEDRKRPAQQLLLFFQPLVVRDHGLKAGSFDSGKQPAVARPFPTELPDAFDFVAGQVISKLLRHSFVKEYPHR